MIRSGAVSKLHGNSAWEINGRKVREWARTQGFTMTSTAGRDPSNNPRAERCVGILKRMGRTMPVGSGLLKSGDLKPLGSDTCGISPPMFRTKPEGVVPRWSAIINRKTNFFGGDKTSVLM